MEQSIKIKGATYISCPLIVSQSVLDEVTNKLLENHESRDVKFWERGTVYNSDLVTNCEKFVLILPNNNFTFEYFKLTPGCKKELKKAIKLKKEVYIAYKRSLDGEFYFYKVDIDKLLTESIVSGIQGSYDSIFSSSGTTSTNVNDKILKNTVEETVDKRVYLLI